MGMSIGRIGCSVRSTLVAAPARTDTGTPEPMNTGLRSHGWVSKFPTSTAAAHTYRSPGGTELSRYWSDWSTTSHDVGMPCRIGLSKAPTYTRIGLSVCGMLSFPYTVPDRAGVSGRCGGARSSIPDRARCRYCPGAIPTLFANLVVNVPRLLYPTR